MFRVRAGLVSRRDSPLREAISRVTPMTSLPSNPKDAAAPVAERRSAQRQTILTELLPEAVPEHKRHDPDVMVPRQ